MTQPTQAQIEAAAKAMSEKRPVTYTQMAIVALTAAAQVGEQEQTYTQAQADSMVKQTWSATIERCAQVAAEWDHKGDPAIAMYASVRIAAAIRALKDET